MIAIVHAPSDEELCRNLLLQLRPSRLTTWCPAQVPAGELEAKALTERLAQAELVVLMVSPELLKLLETWPWSQALEYRLVPVLVRPSMWAQTAMKEMQPLPRNRDPVCSWVHQEEAWLEVAREIVALASAEHGAGLNVRLWHVPQPSAYFTGREAELGVLRTALVSGRAQAVSGLGGTGKTQLALVYAQRFADSYNASFFLHSESSDLLHESLMDMARVLGLSVRDPAVVESHVLAWLKLHPGWLLILDNADDLPRVRRLCREAHGGHVLLTTRASDCGAVGIARPLRLGTLRQDESMDMLRQRQLYMDESEEQAMAELANELGHLPLALEQAAAYMAARQMMVARYLAKYRRRRFLQLNERTGEDNLKCVATTWSLNMDAVRRESPQAAALLECSAFLAPDAIPEELLKSGRAELGPELAAGDSEGDWLDEALGVLLRYSLVSRRPLQRTYNIHRLVQEVVRARLDEEACQTWARRVVHAVNRVFPTVDFRSWDLCARLLEHAKVAGQLLDRWEMNDLAGARLLNEAGAYLWHRGKYAEAEPLFLRALAIREKMLPPDHPEIALSLTNVANLYRDQEKYHEAEPLFQQALAIHEKMLVPDHLAMAAILNSLARLYRVQRRHTEAEPLFLRALAIREKALPPDHPAVAQSLNNMASLYAAQGKYVEAEPLFLRALAIREKALDRDHPDVALSLNNLANLYRDRDRHAEAEPLFLRALTIYERVFPLDHPRTEGCRKNLADLYDAQGRIEEACRYRGHRNGGVAADSL